MVVKKLFFSFFLLLLLTVCLPHVSQRPLTPSTASRSPPNDTFTSIYSIICSNPGFFLLEIFVFLRLNGKFPENVMLNMHQ